MPCVRPDYSDPNPPHSKTLRLTFFFHKKFGLMHGRSGMPIRFRYLEVCVDTLSVLKKEQEVFRLRNFQRSGEGRKDRHREPAERKDATETTYTPWDPREIVRRPGNVVVTLHKTLRQQREGIFVKVRPWAFPKSRHTVLPKLVTVCPYIAIYKTDTFRSHSQVSSHPASIPRRQRTNPFFVFTPPARWCRFA